MAVANIISQYGRQQSNPMGGLMQGMQFGQQLNQLSQQRERQNLLEQLGPRAAAGDREAINQLAGVDPNLSAQYAERATAQRQRDFQTLGGLLHGVETDESYQNALMMAEQMGVSPKTLSNLQETMPQFDPNMTKRLLNMYGRTDGAEYSKSLTPAFDAEGRPVFVQPSSAGGARVVPGISPNLMTPEQEMQLRAEQARRVAEAKESTPTGMAKRRAAESQAEQAKLATRKAKQAQKKGENVRRRALNLVDSLLAPERQEAMAAATGPVESRLPTLSKGTADFEVDLEALNALLTSENLDMMSGVLSESDIKILRDVASGGLDLKSSPERLQKRLGDIRRSLMSELGGAQTMFETPQSVQSANVDEIRNFVQQAAPEELDKLPEEVRSAIANKLQGGR